MTPRVVLVGLPGAGKSSTGRRLAHVLAVPFADSDDLIEESGGRSVPDLIVQEGEAGFRAVERSAVLRALGEFEGVLSLGGGALGSAEVRQGLTDSGVPVVFLRARLATLAARVGDAATRPLLSGDPVGRLHVLAAERTPVYEAAAAFAVDTDSRTPGQVAATIAARLDELEVRR